MLGRRARRARSLKRSDRRFSSGCGLPTRSTVDNLMFVMLRAYVQRPLARARRGLARASRSPGALLAGSGFHRSLRSPAARGRVAMALRSQDGFTLVEMLVVVAILPVVVATALIPLEFGQTQTPKNVEYAQSISSTSAGLQRMMRDIRQAYRVNSTTPNSIDFNAVLGSSDQEILYECNLSYPSNTGNTHYQEYRRCRRVSATTGTALPAIANGTLVIDRLLNGTTEHPVFTFKNSEGNVDPTNPSYVEAQIQAPARGALNSGLSHTISFSNGTSLPNLLSSK
jgi:prepilin-type N-terminal cleavage/methylation domain-containing protein